MQKYINQFCHLLTTGFPCKCLRSRSSSHIANNGIYPTVPWGVAFWNLIEIYGAILFKIWMGNCWRFFFTFLRVFFNSFLKFAEGCKPCKVSRRDVGESPKDPLPLIALTSSHFRRKQSICRNVFIAFLFLTNLLLCFGYYSLSPSPSLAASQQKWRSL